MTKIAIPPDLAGMFAACEDAYEQAAREGYAENPTVIAAVTALKSAWTALHLANNNYATAKGVFSVEFAAIRVDRACRASREAYDPSISEIFLRQSVDRAMLTIGQQCQQNYRGHS
jgi:hypothetical protein